MNIQSISELLQLGDEQSKLAQLSNVNVYAEISYPDTGNHYHSLKLPLNVLLTDIVNRFNYLSSTIDSLCAHINSGYVKLSGDTMTGSLNISNGGGLTVENAAVFKNNVICKLPGSNEDAVAVKNGELICKYDIHGCALTAKWSN